MRWLLDADVLLKVARLGLLDSLEVVAEHYKIEIQWLGSAFYTLGLHRPHNNKTVKRCGRQEVVEDLIKFCSRHRSIELDVSKLDTLVREKLSGLMSTWDIDEGEAMLFVAAAEAGAYVVTDDVRAIQAITREPELVSIRKDLTGKWINLMQLIAILVAQVGFAKIKAAVVKDLACDSAIRAIFGSGTSASENAVSEALAHYIRDRELKGAQLSAALSDVIAGKPRKEL